MDSFAFRSFQNKTFCAKRTMFSLLCIKPPLFCSFDFCFFMLSNCECTDDVMPLAKFSNYQQTHFFLVLFVIFVSFSLSLRPSSRPFLSLFLFQSLLVFIAFSFSLYFGRQNNSVFWSNNKDMLSFVFHFWCFSLCCVSLSFCSLLSFHTTCPMNETK